MGKREFTVAELNAAAARCKARGVSTLIDHLWAAEMRKELGITAEEEAERQREAEAAADARLQRGEERLHEARVDAAEGRLPRK